MAKKVLGLFFLGLFASSWILSACQTSPPAETPTPAARTHIAAIAMPSPSPSPTHSPTVIFTSTLSPTPENTPTATLRPPVLSPPLSLTPLPTAYPAINLNNIAQVDLQAIWGNGAPKATALSEDGSLLAVGTDIGIFLYDSFDFRFVSLIRTTHPVIAIVFSTDNRWIAVLQKDNRILIYDQIQFNLIKEIILSEKEPESACYPILFYSPDSSALTLLSKSSEFISVLSWNTQSWEVESDFSFQNGLASYVNPSIGVLGILKNDELILQSLTVEDDFRALPLPSDLPRSSIEAITHTHNPITPAAAGDFLLLNEGTTIAYWDILQNEITYRLDNYKSQGSNPCNNVPATCRNPEGGFSFTCSEDEGDDPLPVQLVALSQDDQRLLVSLDSGRTELRSTYTGELLWETDTGYTKAFFSLNDQFIIGMLPDGTFEKRGLLEGDLRLSLKQHPTTMYSLALAPQGDILAAGYNDGWVRIYSTSDGQLLGVLDGSAKSLAFSPDSQLLAAGLDEGTVRIFDLNQGDYYDLGSGHFAAVTGLVFSSDSRILSTSSLDCTLSRWNLVDRYRLANLRPDRTTPYPWLDLTGIPGDGIVANAGSQQAWLIEDQTQVLLLSAADAGLIQAIGLTPDGNHLYFAGKSLWRMSLNSLESLIEVDKFNSVLENDEVRIGFGKDGKLLLIGSNLELTIWEMQEGFPVNLVHRIELPNSMDTLVSLLISSDGKWVILGAKNGLIHIYGVSE